MLSKVEYFPQKLSIKNEDWALTRVAQLLGRHPAELKVAGLIPYQGTCPGFRFSTPVGVCIRGNQPMWYFSLTSMISLPLFLLPFSLKNNFFKILHLLAKETFLKNEDWSKIFPDIQGLKEFISHVSFLKKWLEDVLYQKQRLNQER